MRSSKMSNSAPIRNATVVNPKPRVFLDANILIRGVTLPRFPYEILRHADRGDFMAVFSPLASSEARLSQTLSG